MWLSCLSPNALPFVLIPQGSPTHDDDDDDDDDDDMAPSIPPSVQPQQQSLPSPDETVTVLLEVPSYDTYLRRRSSSAQYDQLAGFYTHRIRTGSPRDMATAYFRMLAADPTFYIHHPCAPSAATATPITTTPPAGVDLVARLAVEIPSYALYSRNRAEFPYLAGFYGGAPPAGRLGSAKEMVPAYFMMLSQLGSDAVEALIPPPPPPPPPLTTRPGGNTVPGTEEEESNTTAMGKRGRSVFADVLSLGD